MASRNDSLQDIFGPSDTKDVENTSALAGSSTATTTLDNQEFDDIFAADGGSAHQPLLSPRSQGAAGQGNPEESVDESSAVGPISASSLGASEDLDNIFGDASLPTAATSLEQGGDLRDAKRSQDKPAKGSAEHTSMAKQGSSQEPGSKGNGSTATGDKEFLEFLYEDDGNTRRVGPGAAASSAQVHHATGESTTPDNSNIKSPAAPQGKDATSEDLHAAAAIAPQSVAASSQEHQLGSAEGYPPESFLRKQRSRELRPLPENPGIALRELFLAPSNAAEGGDGDAASEESGQPETIVTNSSNSTTNPSTGSTKPTEMEGEPAGDDVGYVRRLCAAAGGFLSPEFRPAVWSLLLGLGREPNGAGFAAWREERRANPELQAAGTTAPYKIDLRNDCLALARRLCEPGEGISKGGDGSCNTEDAEEEEQEQGGDDKGKKDPEALAVDIEEVLTFYCTRRSEAYEPVLCALVGPLFSMGLDPPAVSAILHPLVGALTLFLGRGLTLSVRDLAWTHAHRRFHDLCTYHDPELVQHLDRCFPGWEMPLPAESVSRAETSALDQEAAAMVDDLESSLAASLPKRPSSASTSGKAGNSSARTESAEDGEGEDEQGQGLVEPSLLVAASAGLGAASSLPALLPLWDYLLVRQDKHFGFFLLLAALLHRRDDLLAASGPQLRAALAEALSPTDMALRLGSSSQGSDSDEKGGEAPLPLLLWCSEAGALDLATPESFRHHLGLIGEIAEAEHEAAVRARAQRESEAVVGKEGEGQDKEASSPAQQVEDQSSTDKGRPPLLRMRSLMRNAGDKIAADFKNLKLTRTTSGSKGDSLELAPPPPIELSLPQLCLAVSAKELVVAGGCVKGRKLEEVDQSEDSKAGSSPEEGKGGVQGEGEGEGGVELFRRREPLSYFAVDCRPKEQVHAGRFPKSFHLDPSSMDNPEDMAEKIMSVFEPLRGRAHICLMGSGNGYLRPRGTWVQTGGKLEGVGKGEGGGAGEGKGSQMAARDEYSYVNTCALFFIKRGFPFVSVLEGGFAAVHELLMDTIPSTPGGASGNDKDNGGLTDVIVDHDPSAFRLRLSNKDGDASGHLHFVAGGLGGLLFPLSSPIWSRIGAADSSSTTNNIERGIGLLAGEPRSTIIPPCTTPPFPPSSRRGRGVGVGGGGGDRGHEGKRTPPRDGTAGSFGSGKVGAGGGRDGPGNGFFNTAGVFRGMNMNMGMNMNVASMFKGGSGEGGDTGSVTPVGAAATAPDADSSSGAAATLETKQSDSKKADTKTAVDIAARWGVSFGRLGSRGTEQKREVEGAGAGAAKAGVGGIAMDSGASKKESGFGSLFRKAQQGLKAADVTAAFADLRDGPKTSTSGSSYSTVAGGALGRGGQAAAAAGAATRKGSPTRGSVSKKEGVGDAKDGVVVVDEDGEEDGGVFVIGDDGSEASEAPDSDFEGFDGEQRPPSSGGARSAADKDLALLEHRLSGQVKGATMVVDEFLRVSGARMFTVTKHKVTYHDVDATPNPSPEENASTEPETEVEAATAAAAAAATGKSEGAVADPEASSEGTEGTNGDGDDSCGRDASLPGKTDDAIAGAPQPKQPLSKEHLKVRVRAVTELERTVFLSRERILVLACPDGPLSPGLVKSNRHLTELQKMTFMRRDPTLVTLHYFATDAAVREAGGEGVAPSTKRNVYRFGMEDKETFIRIIRSALQRFQS